MAIKPYGSPLYVSEIAAEFGGTIPHYLSEYYGVTTGIPGSGLIRISDFYGRYADKYVQVNIGNASIITPDGYWARGFQAGQWGQSTHGITWHGTECHSINIEQNGALYRARITLLHNLPLTWFRAVQFEDGTWLWANSAHEHSYNAQWNATTWIWNGLGGWPAGWSAGNWRWVRFMW